MKTPKHPDWLSKQAVDHWKTLYPLLCTPEQELPLLAMLCHYLAKHQELVELVANEGDIVETNAGGIKAHPACYLLKNVSESCLKFSKVLRVPSEQIKELTSDPALDKFKRW